MNLLQTKTCGIIQEKFLSRFSKLISLSPEDSFSVETNPFEIFLK